MIMSKGTPNGMCWCDCGGTPKPGSFFMQGHEKRALRYLSVVEDSESTADRLAAQGFVPGLKSLRDETLAKDSTYEECGRLGLDGKPCRIIGRNIGMRTHRADESRHLPL
jgi:hypothetical protein